ncbi:MAG: hypothetical protein ACI87A_003160 [Planctomycetota bacterium]|jgi:hypothetical protein
MRSRTPTGSFLSRSAAANAAFRLRTSAFGEIGAAPLRVIIAGGKRLRSLFSADSMLRESKVGSVSQFYERSPGSNHGGNRLPGRASRVDCVSPLAGTTVEVEHPVTVMHLADLLSVRANDVLKIAWREFGFGSVKPLSDLAADQAILLAQALGVELRISE